MQFYWVTGQSSVVGGGGLIIQFLIRITDTALNLHTAFMLYLRSGQHKNYLLPLPLQKSKGVRLDEVNNLKESSLLSDFGGFNWKYTLYQCK